jgi:RNA polymerase sigma-70 factor (ECF subfamily)
MDVVEEQRFCEYVAGRSPALLRTAYLLMGDRGRAEELVQTALVKTYLAWGRIRDVGALDGYVRRVMATTATSWGRRRWSGEVASAVQPEGTVGDSAGELAEADEMRRLLLTLPARQRTVLVLRFYDDFSEGEVAAALGISRGAVSAYAARGLAALRVKLTEEVLDR